MKTKASLSRTWKAWMHCSKGTFLCLRVEVPTGFFKEQLAFLGAWEGIEYSSLQARFDQGLKDIAPLETIKVLRRAAQSTAIEPAITAILDEGKDFISLFDQPGQPTGDQGEFIFEPSITGWLPDDAVFVVRAIA